MTDNKIDQAMCLRCDSLRCMVDLYINPHEPDMAHGVCTNCGEYTYAVGYAEDGPETHELPDCKTNHSETVSRAEQPYYHNGEWRTQRQDP